MTRQQWTHWTKVGLLVAVAAYAITFVAKNTTYEAKVWLFFFVEPTTIKVLWLILLSAVLGAVLWWLLKMALGWTAQPKPRKTTPDP